MTEWRTVPGFDGYEASEDGRVRSHRRGALRELSQHRDGKGYARVNLRRDGQGVQRPVHLLVCLAFHGPRPDGHHVRHLDGTRRNHATNLVWGTPSENMRDRIAHGQNPQARKDGCPQGHPYDAANTMTRLRYGATWRECRACRREKDRVRDASRVRSRASS